MEKEEILINTQLALFFDKPIDRPDELWPLFNKEMGGVFDQIPSIFPLPNQLQLLDVPIIQAVSSNRVYSCNMAKGRVDYFHAGIGKQKFRDIKSDFLIETEKYFNFFSSKTKIKRIGFVIRFFIQDDEQAKTISKLLDRGFRELHGGDTHEAYIRFVSRDKIDIFDVNNFTSIEKFSANISEVGNNIKGILITRDFNTIPEKNYQSELDIDKVKKFMEEAEKKIKLEDIKNILWME